MTTRQDLPENLQRKLKMVNIAPETIALVPEAMARKYKMVPLAIKGDVLRLAMANPTDIVAIDTLGSHTSMRIEPEYFSAKEVEAAIDYYYKEPDLDSDYSSSDVEPGNDSHAEIAHLMTKVDSLSESDKEQSVKVEEASSPIVRALSLILNDAIKIGASDVHFQPQEKELLVRYRVDGTLHDVLSLPVDSASLLISRIKIMSNLNIADHRRPQDGQFAVDRKGSKGQIMRTDIRVGIVPSAHGETAALRIHDTSNVLMGLSQLGFTSENYTLFHDMLQVPHGMILVSGPTGAGKTTTLYASISNLDNRQRNIVTIEDPVEYDFYHITQIPVNVRSGVTFAAGLRSVLRMDPDVILIGEIRDSETAQIAIQSALTGHLVLSSIHANDAVGVISRLLDLGIEPFLIASALVGVVSQRMVRKICPHCVDDVEGSLLEQMAYFKNVGEERTEFSQGIGCELCTNGYRGRTGIFEMLRVTDDIRSIIVAQGSAIALREQALQEGMTPLMKSGMLKVKENLTTPSEVLRNAYSI